LDICGAIPTPRLQLLVSKLNSSAATISARK
jgi:hypothetical protein